MEAPLGHGWNEHLSEMTSSHLTHLINLRHSDWTPSRTHSGQTRLTQVGPNYKGSCNGKALQEWHQQIFHSEGKQSLQAMDISIFLKELVLIKSQNFGDVKRGGSAKREFK